MGHGALTTFHAESPEAALVRMRSPPLSVGESFLLLIWSFIQMSTVTLVSGKQVRRVASIVELVPDTSSLSFRLEKIFEWDSQRDTFSPDDPADVFGKSSRLRSAAKLRGLTERGAIRELSDRSRLVSELVSQGVFDYKEVTERAFSYYRGKGAFVRENARG